MNCLVVGFGAIGCRHAQALLGAGHQVIVFEPSDEQYGLGLQRIGVGPDQSGISRLEDLQQISSAIDFAVVATSAGPRLSILLNLINQGMRRFLLEKVLFQSVSDYHRAVRTIEAVGGVAYCNFPNRYIASYIHLREKFQSRRIQMQVIGGNVGLGCNAIHYLDLFEYITGDSIETAHSMLEESGAGNKRGSEYREYTGTMNLYSSDGSKLLIHFDSSSQAAPCILVQAEDQMFLFSEGEESGCLIEANISSVPNFKIIPASQLTHRVLEDIVAGQCLLPSIQEAFNVHRFILQEIGSAFFAPYSDETRVAIT